MAEFNTPGWVAAGVRQGLTASEALKQFRQGGGSVRDAVWYRLYAQQRVATESMVAETTKPLSAMPAASEIVPLTTKRATGYLQTLDIYTRVKGTNIIVTKPFMFSGSELMTRGDALSKALTMMQQAIDEERYEEVLLGGVYTGTRIMTPGEVS